MITNRVMNREGAKDAKEEKEENAVLPSRYERLRGLIIPTNKPDFEPYYYE